MTARDTAKSYVRAVGRAVRAIREKTDLSQEALALRIGIDRTYVSGVERGTRNPSIRLLHRIAQGLRTTPSAILAVAESME